MIRQSPFIPLKKLSSVRMGVKKLISKKRRFSSSMGTPETCEGSSRKRSKEMGKESRNKRPEVFCPVTMEKAKALKAILNPTYPSFIKSMRYSNVVQSFLLSVPAHFCKTYLPNCDVKIILEGDNGLEYETNFLARSIGLSGGWRRFALDHKLREGDVLVFQLIRPDEFKVHIVRANILDRPTHERNLETAVNGGSEHVPCPEENHQIYDEAEIENELGNQRLSVERDKDHSPTEIRDDSTSFGSFVDSENFSVVFNGFPLDSYISFSERVKYNELCRALKSNPHDQLLKSVSHKFAAEIISGTVEIVDLIKNCSPTSHDFEEWKTKLEAFKLLGMDVGFLLDLIMELSGLVAKYHECDEAKRYSEVIIEENRFNEEIAATEKMLKKLKEEKMELQSEREALDAHFQKLNETFELKAKTLAII